jgi:hypothetical protein
MARKVLLVAHGRLHPQGNPGYATLNLNELACATFIDVDESCKPDYAIDVTSDYRGLFCSVFDHIYVMFAPRTVLQSRMFWKNVAAWLKKGGIVQTILPQAIRKKESSFARSISCYTKLRAIPKYDYMLTNIPAVVLKRY